MSPHTQLVLAIGVFSLIGIGAVTFTCWLAWAVFWDVFDFLMEQRIRLRNNKPRAEELIMHNTLRRVLDDRHEEFRRANQFHIPACFRDKKGVHR